MAGVIIFSACFTYGVDVGSGPSLTFVTLPNVFNSLPMGSVWECVFFLFLFFASFSTCLALFEAQIACMSERFRLDRRRACLVTCPLMAVLTLPCILGFNVLSGFTPFGAGSTVQDLEDFVLSYLMLPIGGLVMVLFCTSRRGWGWKSFLREANTGDGMKVRSWMRVYMTYVLPVLIVIVMIVGLVNFF